jgi:hypothetical protein
MRNNMIIIPTTHKMPVSINILEMGKPVASNRYNAIVK